MLLKVSPPDWHYVMDEGSFSPQGSQGVGMGMGMGEQMGMEKGKGMSWTWQGAPRLVTQLPSWNA